MKHNHFSDEFTLSVIIVNYNTRDLLEQCLASVFSSAGDLALQVIVSDNGSTDGSLEMCAEKFPNILLLDNGNNLGFGAANNVARDHASAEFILFLNSDTVVQPGVFESSIDFLRNNTGMGALGCRLMQPGETVQFSVAPFTSIALSMQARGVGATMPFRNPDFYYQDHSSVDYVAGAYLLARAEVLQLSGWFDEQFFMYAEEMDLCWRIRKAGYSVGFFSGAEILHLGGMSSSGSTRSDFWRTISKLRFIRKHHSWGYFQVFKGLAFGGLLLRRLAGEIDGKYFRMQIDAFKSLDYRVQ